MLYATLLLLSVGLGSTTASEGSCSSISYNPQDDLQFVNPELRRRGRESSYPPIRSKHREDQWLESTCCATGFDYITWDVNGTRVDPSDDRYRISGRGQVVEWNYPTPGLTTLTCTLHKQDSQLRLSHNKALEIVSICKKGFPWFTEPPEDQCAGIGDDITFSCEVSFSDDNNCTHPFFRKAYLGVRDGEMEQDFPHYFGMSRLSFDEIPSDSMSTRIKMVATIHNVTKDMYELEYYCSPMGVAIVKSQLVRLVDGPCQSKLVEMSSAYEVLDLELAAHIAIPLVAVFCLVIFISSISLCKKREIKIWWNTHIRWNKANCRYDAYLLHSNDSKDQLMVIDALCPQLELHYNICLPDRDFVLGAVIPEQVTERMRVSKRAIVLLSDSILTTDWLALSIAFAIQHCIPLIFIKYQLTQDMTSTQIPELNAAVSVSTVLEYPSGTDQNEFCDFYSKLYQVLPLAKKPPQTYEDMDKGTNKAVENIINIVISEDYADIKPSVI